MAKSISPDIDTLAKTLGEFVQEKTVAAIDDHGRFTLALSGGSLPKILSKGFLSNSCIDFSKWHVFFADERCVPLEHADSNYKACYEAFLAQTTIPAAQIYKIDPSKSPKEAAEDYEEQLKAVFGSESFPALDLILLGLGPDGHTCSLFPDHELLSETKLWVASIQNSPKPPAARITLTFPVVNNARHIAFVATGSGKADVIKSILSENKHTSEFPAAMVRPTNGNLYWFMDAEAAQKLSC